MPSVTANLGLDSSWDFQLPEAASQLGSMCARPWRGRPALLQRVHILQATRAGDAVLVQAYRPVPEWHGIDEG